MELSFDRENLEHILSSVEAGVLDDSEDVFTELKSLRKDGLIFAQHLEPFSRISQRTRAICTSHQQNRQIK